MADINTGEILEALNEKMDRNANNITKPYLPVFLVATQRPTAANNYTWYRLYSDGWVEQGGAIINATTYQLPIKMADTNYYINVSWDGGKSATFYPNDFQVRNLTTTSFYTTASRNGSNVQGRCWEVKGYAG